MMRFWRAATAGLLSAALTAGAVGAQTSPPPATLTQPAPSSPPQPSSPAGSPPAVQPTPPAPTVQTTAPGLPTLVEKAGDPGDVDEVVLPAKPVATLSGQAKWEDGLKAVRGSVAKIRDALDKAGIKVVGRSLTVFTETTDDAFKYEAMLPIDAVAGATTPVLPDGIKLGTTPAGKAFRFVHKGPYDEIDATYETITAYLDAKDIVAKDTFIEEYLADTADPADTAMEINIYVQPK